MQLLLRFSTGTRAGQGGSSCRQGRRRRHPAVGTSDLAVANLDPQLGQLPDDQKKVAALSAAIDVKLLAKDAAAEKPDQSPSSRSACSISPIAPHNAYFKKYVVDTITDADVKVRHDKEVAALPKQEEVRARHILVKTEAEAQDVIKQLDAGKNFADLAKEKSTDPNKADGGDLGHFTKAAWSRNRGRSLALLKRAPTPLSPIKTDFGYHVILVEDKRDSVSPPYDQVKDQVRQPVMRDKYLALLATAKEKSKIDITDEACARATRTPTRSRSRAKSPPPRLSSTSSIEGPAFPGPPYPSKQVDDHVRFRFPACSQNLSCPCPRYAVFAWQPPRRGSSTGTGPTC